MVVKATPAPALKMIQTKIVFVALEVLLNMEPASAQPQAPGFVRLRFEVCHLTMIGLSLSFGPIHHQPSLGPIAGLFIQVT